MYATEDWPMPEALMLNNLIKEFGATAILSGPLGVGEIVDLRTIQSVVAAQSDSDKAEKWAEWVGENKEAAELLGRAREAAKESGFLDD